MVKNEDGTAYYLSGNDSDARVAERLGNGISAHHVQSRRAAEFGRFPKPTAMPESIARDDRRKRAVALLNYGDIAERMDRVMEHLLEMKEHFDTQFLKMVDGQAAHVAEIRGLIAEINTRIAGIERTVAANSKPFTDAVAQTRIPSGQSTMGQPVLFGEKQNGR